MSERTPGRLRIAAVGDIHVREDADDGRLRDLFAEVSRDADVLVLAGDLTDTGTVPQATRLAESMRQLAIPAIAVLGNHDYECGKVDEVRTILAQGGLKLLEGSHVEIGGVGFVGVKGFGGGFGRRMLGSFGEPAIKSFVAEAVDEALRLENAMRQVKTPKSVVVLHYAPVQETVEGEPPEIFPFLGSSRLGETIDRFDVDVVVHGHAHRGTFEGRTPKGTPVYNVAAHIEKPTGKPYALIDL